MARSQVAASSSATRAERCGWRSTRALTRSYGAGFASPRNRWLAGRHREHARTNRPVAGRADSDACESDAPVREEPEGWLVGENWFDATQRLIGDEQDTAMDYAASRRRFCTGSRASSLSSPLPIKPFSRRPDLDRRFAETLTAFRAAVPRSFPANGCCSSGATTPPASRRCSERTMPSCGGLRALADVPGSPLHLLRRRDRARGRRLAGGTGTFPWEGGRDEDLLAFIRMLVAERRRLPALLTEGSRSSKSGRTRSRICATRTKTWPSCSRTADPTAAPPARSTWRARASRAESSSVELVSGARRTVSRRPSISRRCRPG